MWVNFIKKYQNLVISKTWKSQNKVGVFEEISCGNKIGKGNELRQNKKVKSVVLVWWMGGCNQLTPIGPKPLSLGLVVFLSPSPKNIGPIPSLAIFKQCEWRGVAWCNGYYLCLPLRRTTFKSCQRQLFILLLERTIKSPSPVFAKQWLFSRFKKWRLFTKSICFMTWAWISSRGKRWNPIC